MNKLRDLITICRENLYYTQKLQKWHHDKVTKSRSYVPGDKVWLDSKYIKTKNQNCKLEAKFFGPFRVLHLVKKQAYKLEFPKKERIHNIFHVSLLEQDTIKKGQLNDTMAQLELDEGNSEEYEVEAICDSKVYAKKSDSSYLPSLYYLVSWKGYPKEENTWKLASAVLHLYKLISTFHRNYSERLTATFVLINSAPPIASTTAKPTIRVEASSTKQK